MECEDLNRLSSPVRGWGLFLRGLQCLDDDLIPRYFPARRRLVDGGKQGIRDTDLDRGRRLAVSEGSARAWTLAAVLLVCVGQFIAPFAYRQ